VIAVWDPAGLVHAAAAELPLSIGAADGPSDAIAVVDGGAAGRAALAAGALGLVLVVADEMSADDIAAVSAASALRPVVVVRRRLRSQESAPAAVVVADCSAPSAELAAVLRDTVGWIRELTGGSLVVHSVAGTEVGALALLRTHHGSPVTVLTQSLAGVPGGGVIRVSALAAERREVEVDEPAGVLRTRVEREGETAVATGRFESAERAALRRMAAGEPVDELAELLHDVEIADAILVSAG
jgi:hypothetical protein